MKIYSTFPLLLVFCSISLYAQTIVTLPEACNCPPTPCAAPGECRASGSLLLEIGAEGTFRVAPSDEESIFDFASWSINTDTGASAASGTGGNIGELTFAEAGEYTLTFTVANRISPPHCFPAVETTCSMNFVVTDSPSCSGDCHENKNLLIVNYGDFPFNMLNYNVVAKLTEEGYSVTETSSLPGSIVSAATDPVNGYTAVLIGGDIPGSGISSTLSTYLNDGGKVFLNGEITCCEIASAGVVANINAIVPGSSVSQLPNTLSCTGSPGNCGKGYVSTYAGYTVIGNAYRPLHGVPEANQVNTSFCGNGYPENATPTVGFRYEVGSGILAGMMDVNFWFDSCSPMAVFGYPGSKHAVNFVLCGLLCTND